MASWYNKRERLNLCRAVSGGVDLAGPRVVITQMVGGLATLEQMQRCLATAGQHLSAATAEPCPTEANPAPMLQELVRAEVAEQLKGHLETVAAGGAADADIWTGMWIVTIAPSSAPATSIGRISTIASALVGWKLKPLKKYANFMGSPFGGGGAVESPFSTDWAARLLRAVGMLPHCSSLPLSCSVHSALPHLQLQLPALNPLVAGDSLGLPGVQSTDPARMSCLLRSLERAVRDLARFFFMVLHGAYFCAGMPLNTTQRFWALRNKVWKP